jgi:osmotically-inducible protein OsmY
MSGLFSQAVNQQEVAVRYCYGILFLGLLAGCMESAPIKSSNSDNVGDATQTVNKPIVKDAVPVTDGTRQDNTAVNERDQSSIAKTPFDQGNTDSDLGITSGIRQKIVNYKGPNDEGLSLNARNVKIITTGKQVTLRGPVDNADEKALIEKFAKEIAGPDKVTSELNLASQTTP